MPRSAPVSFDRGHRWAFPLRRVKSSAGVESGVRDGAWGLLAAFCRLESGVGSFAFVNSTSFNKTEARARELFFANFAAYIFKALVFNFPVQDKEP